MCLGMAPARLGPRASRAKARTAARGACSSGTDRARPGRDEAAVWAGVAEGTSGPAWAVIPSSVELY